MGKVTGFLEIDRQDRKYRPASDRIRNFKEFIVPLPEQVIRDQASRCMECGIPFCHDMKGLKGCPVNNQIPDWNDLVYRGEWEQASKDLHSTNNFPEFTGRICPAPCEASCTLNIIDSPVTIKSIECAIVDKAWDNGWIKPQVNPSKTNKRIGIIGSGPAGLAAAQQLARAGHNVVVYEKNKKMGGLLRYGIPDFKMEKIHIDRRLEQLSAEGVQFQCGVELGVDFEISDMTKDHDAIILACGSEKPRDLAIEGRNSDRVSVFTKEDLRLLGSDLRVVLHRGPLREGSPKRSHRGIHHRRGHDLDATDREGQKKDLPDPMGQTHLPKRDACVLKAPQDLSPLHQGNAPTPLATPDHD